MLILLSICLVNAPTTCREDRINLSFDAVGAMACLAQAQPLIAQWQESHSEWHIERWRCTTRQALQNDI